VGSLRRERRGAAALALLFLLLLEASCARPPAGPQRFAILRFENLSQDAAVDWMGRAFPEIIGGELAAAPNIYTVSPARIRGTNHTLGTRPIGAPGVSAELTSALASGANRIGYGTYWISNGRLEARLTIQNAATLKDIEVLSASAPAGDLPGAAGALARQISKGAGAHGTANEQAWEDYAAALESPDAATAEAKAGQAIAADPDFGPAYRLLVEIKSQGDRAGALALADQALAREAIHPAGRARLEIEAAGLRDDGAAAQRWLAELAKLEPGDIETWQSLAQTAYIGHDYRAAVSAWQRVLAAEPADGNALNQLGYAAVYAGDFAAATAALRRYAALQPQDANPLDSLGDINLIAGHLQQAEGFYVQAAKKAPNFYGGSDWFKAAVARLMTGDIPGADKLAGQFADVRSAAHDPAVPVFNAEWQWISGRRKAGYAALEQFARSAEAGAPAELASRAYSQLTVWSLLLGDRAAAGQMSAKAAALAGPSSQPEAAMVRFLAQPPVPFPEWQARAERLAPHPAQHAIRDSMLAYALLLSREYAPAAEVLRRLYDAGNDAGNEGLPVLLAWSCLETGRDKEAAPLLAFNAVPPVTGPGLFTSFYFPRIFELRARLEEKPGRTDGAGANARLFTVLSGNAGR
jgi:Tfp pilus assembly protein PilF